ncbi:phenol degradation protein meta [Leptospira hartskeerlii]|uniref:Phenol degradation protein meta n=1 Tax=Leptospira hartskeerlii TaxID=2023177 RepID=A0A2M9XFQ7_9LEPT|nr:transporter [Leptospira hartskeerlii]PJZ26518.1 phenol degradation protein meta [Leptospira hartskeerlii]PJZ34999.1 phenol degradation protein meta [Leptospira hartskeerlii]
MKYHVSIIIILIIFSFQNIFSDEVEVPKSTEEVDPHANHRKESKDQGHQHELRADQIAPAGLMFPHVHKKGSWVLDFRYMGMQMSGLLNGSKSMGTYEALWFPQFDPSVSMPTGSLLTGGPSIPQTSVNGYRYMSVPKSMLMESYMTSAMYGISDDTMIMFMVPVVKNQMMMETSNFDSSAMKSGGVGDISFSAAHRIFKRNDHEFFLNFGLSLPTGSIDERDWMPMMGNQKVPYNMQPGTGTVNYLPGIAYSGKLDRFSWGLGGNANLRSSKNQNQYRFGNIYELSSWIAYSIFSWTSVSIRVQAVYWDNIKGQDGSLDPKMDPQNDPNRQGGNRTDALVGMNFLLGEGIRFGFEAGKPFHQHLNGPQLAMQTMFNVFVRYDLN